MIKRVIIDLIGPILPIGTSINIFREAAMFCELEPPTVLFLKKHWDRNLECDFLIEIARRMSWTKNQMTGVLNKYQELLKGLSYPLQPCLKKQLEDCADKYRLGLIANQNREFIEKHLFAQGIDINVFADIIVTEKACKPDPSILEPFIRAGYQSETSAYVGDSVDYDYRAVQNSGLGYHFIGIKGANDPSDFRSVGIPFRQVLNTFAEIPPLLKVL